MFVLIPRLLKSLAKKLNRITKKNTQKYSSFVKASQLISVGLLLVFIPLGVGSKPSDQNKYDGTKTSIKLDPESVFTLTRPDKSIEIPVGRSRKDLEIIGLSHDPQEIKVMIQETAPKYGVDWRLVYAIGYLESGNFNSSLARSQNNFFGRKASSGTYATWPNTVVAIENQCEYLKTRYIDRGMDTPYEMNHVYAESDTWGAKVTGIMNSL